MRIGIAADHGGFHLKAKVIDWLRENNFEVKDFGANELNTEDDYPDYIFPLSRDVANGRVDRGIALCGSGVGACIAANKINGVRAALIHEEFSARQGVEDDDMNVICLGGRVIEYEFARKLIETFLSARFSGAARHQRRLDKILANESSQQ